MVAGGCDGEERPSQYVVVGASGGSECAVAFFGEDSEPFAPVSGVDFTADQAVALETGHEMSRTSGAEQHSIGEVRHAKSLIRRVEQRDQHIELSDRQTVGVA
jgi:hypothetical protein